MKYTNYNREECSMKYSVACCYMTHNHPDVVEEILNLSSGCYNEHNIDICICDDSDNDDTLEIVKRFQKNGCKSLHYIDSHIAVNGIHKYILLLQGELLHKNYDYIWITKDRVCFSSAYLDKLCAEIDEGHDIILGTNEAQRSDVGICVTARIYEDPTEFYRLYGAHSTNWEALIYNNRTFLQSINWERFNNLYNPNNMCSFVQPLTLFSHLAEMDHCSIRISRYEFNDRFISNKTGSDWGNVMFELWIDRWVAANFSLPSIYDKYKAEVIKSETNLSELFGSVERMIVFHTNNLYNREIFEKYRNMWPFVTDIPVDVLELIAGGDYNTALSRTIFDFENAFATHDFKMAWWLIAGNTWFKDYYDTTTYGLLVMCFNKYRENMQHVGASAVFDGVSSIDDLKKKYGITG